MPNWCSNYLDIEGPTSIVDHFLTLFRNNGFAGHKPEPGNAQSDPQYDWYSWRVRNWGTKWNVTEDDWSVISETSAGDRKVVRLSLLTAWSPPIEWLRAAAAYYLDRPVHFRLAYLEEGNCFSGVVEFWCEEKLERATARGLSDGDPFQTAAHRDALIEFGSDAAIGYTFAAEIAGARLQIPPRMVARYPSLAQVESALALGERDRARNLIATEVGCAFDPTKVRGGVELLSANAYDCSDDGEEALQIEVEEVLFDGGTLVVSVRANLSIAFAVPFVSVPDFYNTCKDSEALPSGVRLWLEDIEFEDYQLITLRPEPNNWKIRSLASLETIYEQNEPSAA